MKKFLISLVVVVLIPLTFVNTGYAQEDNTIDGSPVVDMGLMSETDIRDLGINLAGDSVITNTFVDAWDNSDIRTDGDGRVWYDAKINTWYSMKMDMSYGDHYNSFRFYVDGEMLTYRFHYTLAYENSKPTLHRRKVDAKLTGQKTYIDLQSNPQFSGFGFTFAGVTFGRVMTYQKIVPDSSTSKSVINGNDNIDGNIHTNLAFGFGLSSEVDLVTNCKIWQDNVKTGTSYTHVMIRLRKG